jgi:NADPH:quinone reductase
MNSWVATDLTGESGLQWQAVPKADCGPEQVRIATRAVALNYPDVLITRGEYQFRPEPPFVPGSEASGTVVEVGSAITDFAIGDRVLTVCGVGGFSEEIVVTPAVQQVYSIPQEMSFEEAAGFGMTHGTAIHGLRQRGALKAGETVLVLGAAGGVGSAAVSVAAAMGGRVIAAASTQVKCAFAEQLGAHHTIDYGSQDLRQRVLEITGDDGVDVVFDPVGGALFDVARRCVAWNGRYLVVGFTGGDIPVMLINYPLLKSISLIGVAFGMSAIKDPQNHRDNFELMFDWYRTGALRVAPVDAAPFSALPQACARMRAGQAIGKLILSTDGSH